MISCLIFGDVCLLFSAECQVQSSGVQSGVGLLLPSDSRTCGLRCELDVCVRKQGKHSEHYSYQK